MCLWIVVGAGVCVCVCVWVLMRVCVQGWSSASRLASR